MTNVIPLFPVDEDRRRECAECVHFGLTNGAVSVCWQLREEVDFTDGSDCGEFRWA